MALLGMLQLMTAFLVKPAPDPINKNWTIGGSPGLVVMGDDSCSRGCGFESQSDILSH